MRSKLGISGWLHLEYTNPDGTPGWSFDVPNGATTDGINHLLNTCFVNHPQSPSWYGGLIDNNAFTAVSADDLINRTRNGWKEFRSYANGIRPLILWDVAAFGGSIYPFDNYARFDFLSGGVIRGVFITDTAFFSDTFGVLYATATLAAGQSVDAGGSLRVYYGIKVREEIEERFHAHPIPYVPVGETYVLYPGFLETLAFSGGGLITTGEPGSGGNSATTNTYKNVVGILQATAETDTGSDDLVMYRNLANGSSGRSFVDTFHYYNQLLVQGNGRGLIDGRADLLSTGRYRR